jgi:flagellar biosynthetic protein FliQ
MSEEVLINLGREAVLLLIQVAGPLLLSGLVLGLAVSILQAVTQVQEATLSFIPKIIGVALAFVIFLPYIIQKLVRFTTFLFTDFKAFIQ